jgi:hypothetical protein
MLCLQAFLYIAVDINLWYRQYNRYSPLKPSPPIHHVFRVTDDLFNRIKAIQAMPGHIEKNGSAT